MTSDWINTTVKEFASLQRGHDLPEQDRRDGSVPILGSFGVTGYHDTAIAKGPGVTVGRSGASFGVVTFSDSDYWPLNTALYVTNFHGNNEKFVYYFFKHFDFSSLNSGSAH
jgi:type I restriction enzyme S subunit